MLISFRVRNFLSFKDDVELSMVAGKVRQFPDHVIRKNSTHGVDVLRAALLYGANASGKSNLVKAIDFARSMVVDGAKVKSIIPRKPFKLDPIFLSKPTLFEFVIQTEGVLYTYGFEFDSKQVYEEWLIEIKATTEKVLFRRTTSPTEENNISFNVKASKKELALLELIALGTPPNRLFLHEAIERNAKQFLSVYDWFAESLVVIYPSSIHSLSQIVRGNTNDFGDSLVEYLERFDTGICGYSLQPVYEPSNEIPSHIIEDLDHSIKEGESTSIWNSRGRRYFIKRENEQLKISKLLLIHRSEICDSEIPFDMDEESDGTLRLLDLIPVLFQNKDNSRVVIIDELDRSLHPQLSLEFITSFLSTISSSQLIITTHDINLLDLDLIRRDEIWFTEKDKNGASKIYSLEEFSPRYDKDIRKGYLLGRFGAIPAISKPSFAEEV